jgi:hypothetical protein
MNFGGNYNHAITLEKSHDIRSSNAKNDTKRELDGN